MSKTPARTVRRYEEGKLAYYREKADSSFWDREWLSSLSATTWDSARTGELGWFEKPFIKYLPRDGRIVEAGCGLGRIVAALDARGYQCEGIDYAATTIEKISELLPGLSFRTGDVTSLDVADATYDAYISIGVIEHRKDGPAPFLEEARRVLKPGGTMLISTPCCHPLRALKGKLRLYRGTIDGLSFYQWAYTKEQLTALLTATGFSILEYFPYNAQRGVFDEIRLLKRILDIRGIGWRFERFLNHNRSIQILGHSILIACTREE